MYHTIGIHIMKVKYIINTLNISDAVNGSIEKYSITIKCICPLSKWSFLFKIYSVGSCVLYLYWLVRFSICGRPLVSWYNRVFFWCEFIFKLMLPLFFSYRIIQNLIILFNCIYTFVVLRIIKWRIHVFWFIQTLIFYNIIILVAECMPYFGIHLMLVNKFLRYHSNLFFNFFNWCTLILHLLDNIRYFIDLILHKKFGNSISCGHCGEWLIIKTFVDHWIALPGSLTVFYLFNSRHNILAKV